MNPGLQIGAFRIHYYGIILAVAILAAYWLVRYRTKRADCDISLLDAIVLWSVPLGIVGARLYYVTFTWERYALDSWSIFNIWEGGIAIHGAILGGFLGLVIALALHRRKKGAAKVSLLGWLDILMPGVMLGQIIGRFGNYINQEAFGGPTTLPWGIFIDPERRPDALAATTHFHPTFAYEALWNVLGLGLMILLERKRKLRPGFVLGFYLVWYSVGRFFVEALRTDSLYVGSLRVAQLISLAGVVGGLVLIWYATNRWKKA